MPIEPEKPPEKAKKRLGRPPVEFTDEQIAEIDQHSLNQARNYTIAEALGIEIRVFERHFAKRCSQNRAKGKLEMHKRQRELMLSEGKTACAMAIWLGKQHLEQKEKAELSGDLTVGTVNYAGEASRAAKAKWGERQADEAVREALGIPNGPG